MTAHKSVLLHEAIEGLNLKKDSVMVDGTFGGGGHSKLACELYPGIHIYAIDQDHGTWEREKGNFKNCKISFHQGNFRDLDQKVDGGKVDGIILDLGLSSDQLETSGRGFSFLNDEPLIMTMKENPLPEDLTAGDVVNSWSEANLADIIYGYGEERYARRIARGIVEARREQKIETTFQLVEIIKNSVPASYRNGRIHPATKTFQAIRIAVNDELGSLTEGLKKGWEILKPGGRIAAITFHSLEDRIVKRFNQAEVKERKGKLVNKKPIVPSAEEIKKNPRARSAKLRIIEKF